MGLLVLLQVPRMLEGGRQLLMSEMESLESAGVMAGDVEVMFCNYLECTMPEDRFTNVSQCPKGCGGYHHQVCAELLEEETAGDSLQGCAVCTGARQFPPGEASAAQGYRIPKRKGPAPPVAAKPQPPAPLAQDPQARQDEQARSGVQAPPAAQLPPIQARKAAISYQEVFARMQRCRSASRGMYMQQGQTLA